MNQNRVRCAILNIVAALIACSMAPPAAAGPADKPLTTTEVLAQSTPADWRPLDPENTLYLELASGRVVIELAPRYAPRHVANIKLLARENYFDGLAIVRAQDNYVVQWGDPEEAAAKQRPMKKAQRTLPAEFAHALTADLPFTPLPDGDVYAPEVGLSEGFPAARDTKSGKAWLAHCYGMLGVGRDVGADSGSGAELYVVIGHAPRHLDRNVTLAGRVVQGIERLSTLPRGTGPLGFYEKPEQYVPIKSIRVAADVPPAQRSELEVLRTDTATFAAFVAARRTRLDSWFVEPTGRVELCNVAVPVRVRALTKP
jgi:cyclophilin family peptidyl-prolyl cis-trans isomerase